MKIISLLMTVVTLVITSYELEAASLHAIIVADTTDESIGDSTAVDLSKVKRQISTIARHTDLQIHEVVLKGFDVKPAALLDALHSLEFEEDDVVVFYYSGHGFRTESKEGNPWPNLYFSLVGEGIDLSYVREVLEEKHPRFLLVMADVCNSFVPDDFAPPLIFKILGDLPDQELVKANYRSLFLETEGTLLISSSTVGEYSWGTLKGGVFTIAFLQNLQAAVKEADHPDWEIILQRSHQDVSEMQHPQWEFTKKS
jgi:hypothetical protein